MYEREVMPSLGGEGRGCASGVVAVDIGGGGAVETPLGWVGCLQLLQLLTAAPWRSFVCVGEVGWLVGWLVVRLRFVSQDKKIWYNVQHNVTDERRSTSV